MKITEIVMSESFNSDVQGKLVRATNDLFTTSAVIGNRTIVFNATMFQNSKYNNVWEIEFTEKSQGGSTYAKSGSGNELQVFSFVIESLKELVSRYHPEEIIFGSHKADGNRTNLYKRMANRIKIPGYHLGGIESSNSTDTFSIVRDDK